MFVPYENQRCSCSLWNQDKLKHTLVRNSELFMHIKGLNPVPTFPHHPPKTPFGCDCHSSVPKPKKMSIFLRKWGIKLESSPLGGFCGVLTGRIPTKHPGRAGCASPSICRDQGTSATSPWRPCRLLARGLSQQLRLGVLCQDSASASSASSASSVTGRGRARLPAAVLRACSTANTALVALVGISTLQIMPSQQETHSCRDKRVINPR